MSETIETIETIETKNPATGEVLETYVAHTAAQVEEALERASTCFATWRTTSFEARAELMRAAAALLRERREALAALMTDEMGKTIRAARAEVDKCAWVCEHYADRAAELLAPQLIETDATLSMRRFDPLGPILAVMPWNFPLWQVFRFAAPYLMAGDVGLLKHASNTPGCALAIEAIFRDAGFLEGAFQALLIGNEAVEGVILDDRVKGVTLTGSTRAGRAVGGAAGRAIKPSVLELGGSDPFIVLDDADLEAALDGAVTARMINNGQSCIAAKRFIVVDALYDAFVEGFATRLDAMVMGDPRAETTDLGPMAREDLRDELHELVVRSVAEGARVVRGGEVPEGVGCFYPATLLADVTPEMAVAREETFGPVAPVLRVASAEEAVRVANDSAFGLGASVWTRDLRRGLALAAQIESGHVAINGIVKSDPRLPFGGIKTSGYGRELSREGILAFVNTKTVWAS